MRLRFYLLFLLLPGIKVSAQDSLNMTKVFQWDDSTVLESYNWGGMLQQYNEIWGYYDSVQSREYAIIGTATGTYFFDVTNEDSIYIADYEPGKDTAEIHRDFKTYKNYLYGVADEGASSLQIFDMSTLPDSVTKVYDSSEFAVTSHNCFVDGDRLYLCGVVTDSSKIRALRILDISNPVSPVFLKDIMMTGQGSYTHDIYVRNDTAYCSNGTSGLFIYDLTDINNPTLLASITTYDDQGYNHSSWLSEDGKTLFFVDENLGLGIKAFDVSDMLDIKSVNLFRSNDGAMPHNVFVKGTDLYVSYYHDGVWIFDVKDPTNPIVKGYYDTYEELSGYKSYQGCWGVYPYLPSGLILASDFSNGLFVLRYDDSMIDTTGLVKSTFGRRDLKIYPTVTNGSTFLQVPDNYRNGVLEVHDPTGKKIRNKRLTGEALVHVSMSRYSSGTYFFRVYSNENRENIFLSGKLIKR